MLIGCASPAPAPLTSLPPPTVEQAPVSSTFRTTVDNLAGEAARRIRETSPSAGPIALFVTAGQGGVAIAESVRRELARDPRVVFSTVETTHGEPIADSSVSTAHVHPVETRVIPTPMMVIVCSESNGVLYVAARNGDDPLEPPRHGWLWILEARR